MPFDYGTSTLNDSGTGIAWNANGSTAVGFGGNWGDAISGGVVSGAVAASDRRSEKLRLSRFGNTILLPGHFGQKALSACPKRPVSW